jgi:cell division protein FtsB
MWAPALVAILGIVASVLFAVGKVKTAIAELRKTEDIANLTKELQNLAAENKELRHRESLLLDEITKIKNYAENIRK